MSNYRLKTKLSGPTPRDFYGDAEPVITIKTSRNAL